MAFRGKRARPRLARDFERLVPEIRYEKDLACGTLRDQAILKIKAAHTPYPHVDREAAAGVDPGERWNSSADSNTIMTKRSDLMRLSK
jgi:hypothetical protein